MPQLWFNATFGNAIVHMIDINKLFLPLSGAPTLVQPNRYALSDATTLVQPKPYGSANDMFPSISGALTLVQPDPYRNALSSDCFPIKMEGE